MQERLLTTIFWTSYQGQHITARHGVTPAEFEEAWKDREDLFEGFHEKHGPYYESLGFSDCGRLIEMVWRWQEEGVWPVTAYVDEEESA